MPRSPVGPVTAHFRDDVSKIVAPDAWEDGAIILPGRITQRTYPGGEYRYRVAVAGRSYSVTDDRNLDVDTPIGLRLPQAGLEDCGHAGEAEFTEGVIEFDEIHCVSPVLRSMRSR